MTQGAAGERAGKDALEALRALSEAVTPGPWNVVEDEEYVAVTMGGPDDYVAFGTPNTTNRADAAFTVAAVNYVRAALAAAKDSPEAPEYPSWVRDVIRRIGIDMVPQPPIEARRVFFEGGEFLIVGPVSPPAALRSPAAPDGEDET